MNKSIFKELFIITLLLIVVIFTLGLLFYDSLSIDVEKIDSAQYEDNGELNKIINEIGAESSNTNEITFSKSISKEELEEYKAKNTLETGKKNPFSEVSNTSKSNDSTGIFFENKTSK